MNDNSNDIVVFFKNHKRARFKGDKVAFLNDAETGRFDRAIADGKSVVNWDNVCFAQKWVEPKEDLFDDAE